jgi:hypothetical protein
MAPARRKMLAFKIGEISAVDRPAQAGATADITKNDVDKAQTKTEDGKNYPSSDYAYVPDPEKPSTWKLRLTSTPGGDPDPRIVGAAAAALGPGFRGNKVQIPQADREKVKAKVRSAWKEANPDKETSEMPDVLKSLSEVIVKRYIDPSEGVVSFSQVFAEEAHCRQFYDELSTVRPYIEALECSLKSIAGSPDVEQDTKMTMMRNTVEDFMTMIRSQWSGAEAVMMSALGKSTEEIEEMAKNTADDLQKEVAELKKKLEAAQKGADGDLQAKVTELEKNLEQITAERDEATAKAAMTPEARAYMTGMSKEERKAFMSMTPDQQMKAMKKSAEDDENITVKGRTIRKSAVGAEMFEFLKAQEEEKSELRKAADEAREKSELAEYTKRAESEFNHLPGTTIAKVKVLAAVNDLPNEELQTLTKMLEAGEKAIKGAFTRIGSRSGQEDPITKNGGSGDTFMKRVSEIQKGEGVKRTEAMSLARKRYPDDFVAYRNGGDA